MTRDDSNLLKSGLVQLVVAVVGGLVVWYAIVEVKIAKAETQVAQNTKDIVDNRSGIEGLKKEQKVREKSIADFYRDQWPSVGANTAKIEVLRESLADIKKSHNENRKLLLRILQRVK